STVLVDCSRPHRALHSFPTRRSSDLRHNLATARREGDVHKNRLILVGEAHALKFQRIVYRGHHLRTAIPGRFGGGVQHLEEPFGDRKSTRLNSSHVKISYAVFCLKKK